MRYRPAAIISICLLIGVGLYWGWINLGTWFAKNDIPRPCEVIICLNGKDRIKKAADLYHQGLAPDIILTVQKDKILLTSLGVPDAQITLAPGPRTTFQEALVVAPVLRHKGYRSALVVTDPFHQRRVQWTFRHVLKHSPRELVFVTSDMPWGREGWWKNKEDKFFVYSEVVKLGWYWMAYGLLGLHDDPPWAIALKPRIQAWLKAWANR